MTKEVYQEDLHNATIEIMDIIDKVKGFEWSATPESDDMHDVLVAMLEIEFNYPEFRNHN